MEPDSARILTMFAAPHELYSKFTRAVFLVSLSVLLTSKLTDGRNAREKNDGCYRKERRGRSRHFAHVKELVAAVIKNRLTQLWSVI